MNGHTLIVAGRQMSSYSPEVRGGSRSQKGLLLFYVTEDAGHRASRPPSAHQLQWYYDPRSLKPLCIFTPASLVLSPLLTLTNQEIFTFLGEKISPLESRRPTDSLMTTLVFATSLQNWYFSVAIQSTVESFSLSRIEYYYYSL